MSSLFGMSSLPRPTRIVAGIVAAIVAVSLTALVLHAADEGELLKQIKTDVFDQNWAAVLTNCDQFIAQFSRSQALPRSYYYKAQALEHMKGREDEAVAAYTDFLMRFPSETGAIREDALLSRMSLAVSLWLKGNRKYVDIIMKGMDEKGYPRIFAAIQASKIEHAPARAKAIPILKDTACSEDDEELKNECVLALLRIDPKALGSLPCDLPGLQGKGGHPPTPPMPPGAGAHKGPPKPPGPPAPPAAGEARLIRVEVFDKAKNQVTVRVNMPLAFAELLFASLGPELQGEIENEMKVKGIHLEKMWNSLKKGGKQTIVEIDEQDQHVRVWIE